MAKRRKVHAHDRAAGTAGRYVRIPSTVTVQRRAYGGAHAFEACVIIGKRPVPKAIARGALRTGCETGRNPRQALRNALRQLSKYMGKRRGAFHGK